MCEVDVGGDGQLAGTRIDPELLASGITRVGAFALSVWDQIDQREEVQQVAAAVSIVDPQHKVFGLAPDANRYSLGFNIPTIVVAPEPALVIRAAEMNVAQLPTRLVAEVRRAYADAGAVAS